MDTENKKSSDQEQSASEGTAPKKSWRPLHLKVLDVPRSTQGAFLNRLDPTEDFFAYRAS